MHLFRDDIAQDLIIILFLCIFSSTSVALHCPEWSRTREVSLSTAADWVTTQPLYTAINVTLRPTQSSVSQLYRFLPAVTWSNVSCDHVTPSAMQSRIASSTAVTKSTEDIMEPDNLAVLPDWSLWRDRSVLVVNLHPVQWDSKGYPCPRLALCSILGLPSTTLLSQANSTMTFCQPELSQFSTSCRDSTTFDSVYPVLFLVSSALAVQVDRLGEKPVRFNSTLRFVASAGYRLPPGVFQCPSGLFACPSPTDNVQQLPTSLQWDQRICLPLALRCDGTANCPGTDFDEQDCANPRVMTNFPPVPNELEQLLTHVPDPGGKMSPWLSRELVLAGVSANQSWSLLLYGLLFGLLLIFAAFLVIGWYVYKRTRPKSYETIIAPHVVGGGKDYGDLVDEACREPNGTVGHKTDFINGGAAADKLHVECV